MYFTNMDFVNELKLSSDMFINNCVLPRKRLYGQIDDLEKNFLFNFVRTLKPNRVLEFSCCYGYSSIVMCNAFKSAKYKPEYFHTYEILEDCVVKAANHFAIFELEGYINIIPGDVLETMDEHKLKECDFLFVDSDHGVEFCKKYVDRFFPLLKKGCWVAIHDMFFDPINGETECVKNFIIGNNIKNYFFIPDLLDIYNIENKEVNGTVWFRV